MHVHVQCTCTVGVLQQYTIHGYIHVVTMQLTGEQIVPVCALKETVTSYARIRESVGWLSEETLN